MDGLNIINAIRNDIGGEYASSVPVATESNLLEVGNAIVSYIPNANQFIGALVNKIALTVVESKLFNNKLSILKSGALPLGDTVETLYTNPANSKNFDGKDGNLFTISEPDVKVTYNTINRSDQYEVSINRVQLKRAFTKLEELNSFITKVINSLYVGANIDEFNLMKNCVGNSVKNGFMKTIESPIPVDKETSTTFLKLLRGKSSSFEYPSSLYNSWEDKKPEGATVKPCITWVEKQDQIIILRDDIKNSIDIDLLAHMFNIEKGDIGGIITVDNFGEDSNVMGVVMDKAWWKVFDAENILTDFFNAKNHIWNYYLTIMQVIGMSLTANAIAIVEPTTIVEQVEQVEQGEI